MLTSTSVDLPVALRAVDGLHRAVVEYAGRLEIGALLEFAHGIGDLGVVFRIVGVFGMPSLARSCGTRGSSGVTAACFLVAALNASAGPSRNLGHRSVALAAQLGELRLQILVELVRRIVAVERRGSVLGGRDVGQHFGGIGRMLGIEDVGGDLRPVHPAALRLAGIVEHAGGQFQLGFGELIRRSGGSEIRHRIFGRIEPFGGGILQAGDHAFAARRSIFRPGSTAARTHAPRRTSRRPRARSCDRNSAAIWQPAFRAVCRQPADRPGRRCSQPSTGSLAGSAAGAVAVAGVALQRGGAVAVSLVFAGAVTISAGLVSGSAGLCGGGRLARLRRRLVDCLGCIGHRRGGSILKSPMLGRRNVGRLGARNCGVDREFGGAGAGRDPTGPPVPRSRKPRGTLPRRPSARGQSQHGSSNSHASSHPLGRNCPGMEQSLGIVCHSLRGKRRPRSVSVGTPAHQRFKRRRYMCPFHAASAMRDNSRQTDLKQPNCIRVARFCHAPRHLSVTCKPRFKGSETADLVGPSASLPPRRHNRRFAQSASCAPPSAGSSAAASSSLR